MDAIDELIHSTDAADNSGPNIPQPRSRRARADAIILNDPATPSRLNVDDLIDSVPSSPAPQDVPVQPQANPVPVPMNGQPSNSPRASDQWGAMVAQNKYVPDVPQDEQDHYSEMVARGRAILGANPGISAAQVEQQLSDQGYSRRAIIAIRPNLRRGAMSAEANPLTPQEQQQLADVAQSRRDAADPQFQQRKALINAVGTGGSIPPGGPTVDSETSQLAAGGQVEAGMAAQQATAGELTPRQRSQIQQQYNNAPDTEVPQSSQPYGMTTQEQQEWIARAKAKAAARAQADQSFADWKSRGSLTGWSGAAQDVGIDLQGAAIRTGQAAAHFQGAIENTLASVSEAATGQSQGVWHRDAEQINNWWDQQAADHPIHSTTIRIASDGIPIALKMGGAIAAGPAGPLIFAADGAGQYQAQAQPALRKLVDDGQMTQAEMDDKMSIGGGKAAAVSAFTYYMLPQLPPIAAQGGKEIVKQVGMQAWQMFAAGVKQSVIEQTAHAAIANEQYGAPMPLLSDVVRESLVSGAVASILHTIHAASDPHMEVRDLAKQLGLDDGALPMLSKIQAVANAVDSGKLSEQDGMHALATSLDPADLPYLQRAVVAQTAAVRDQYRLPPEAAPMVGKVAAYNESVKDGSMSQPEALAKLNESLTPQDIPFFKQMVEAHQFPDDGLRTVTPEDRNSRLLQNSPPPGRVADAQRRFDNWLRAQRQTSETSSAPNAPPPKPPSGGGQESVSSNPQENTHVRSDADSAVRLPYDPRGQDRPNEAAASWTSVPNDSDGSVPVRPRAGRTLEEAHAELHDEVASHYPDAEVTKTPKGWLVEHPDGLNTPIKFDADAVRAAAGNPASRLASIVGRYPGVQIKRADGSILTIPDRVSDLSDADRKELLESPRFGIGGAVKGGTILLHPEIASSRILAEEVYHEKMRRLRMADPGSYNDLLKPFRDGRSQLEAEEAAFGKVDPGNGRPPAAPQPIEQQPPATSPPEQPAQSGGGEESSLPQTQTPPAGDVKALDRTLDSTIPNGPGNSHGGWTIQQSMQDSFTRGIPDYPTWTQFNKPLAKGLGDEGPALWDRAQARERSQRLGSAMGEGSADVPPPSAASAIENRGPLRPPRSREEILDGVFTALNKDDTIDGPRRHRLEAIAGKLMNDDEKGYEDLPPMLQKEVSALPQIGGTPEKAPKSTGESPLVPATEKLTKGGDSSLRNSPAPLDDALATITGKARELAIQHGGIHPRVVQELLDAIDTKDVPTLKNILDLQNKMSRNIFAGETGRKLPNTITGTNGMIETWAKGADSSMPPAAPDATITPEQPNAIKPPSDRRPSEPTPVEREGAIETAGGGAGESLPEPVSKPGGRGEPDGGTGLAGVGGDRDSGRPDVAGGGPGLGETRPGGPEEDHLPAEPVAAGELPDRHGTAPAVKPGIKGQNHVILPEHTLAPRGDGAKFDANIKAVKILRRLEQDNRHATPEEQQALAQYTGWGWAGERFNPDKPQHAQSYAILKELLTDEEFRSARASTLNAHYTSPDVIRPMWELAKQLGFTGGHVFEPAVGVGHFFGLMPQDIASKSTLAGTDLDTLSANIASKLYPHADIQNKGFEVHRLTNNSQDLNISNVPFGSFKLAKARDYPNDLIHDYFFKRGLDKLKPGGLQIFITSDGTLDKLDGRVRREIAEKADLVGAIRLPNNAFQGNAGTQVTTDIVVLRKKDGSGFKGEPFANLSGVGEGTYKDKQGKSITEPIRVNEYFAAHPENVLGEHTLAGTMYSAGDYALVGKPGQDTGAMLRKAIEGFPKDVFGKAPPADATEQAGAESNEGEKELAFIDRDGQIYQIQNGKLTAPDWLTTLGYGADADKPITPAKAAERLPIARLWIKLKGAATELFTAENRLGVKDKELVPLRKELNRLYDEYRKKFGALTKRMPHTEKARFLLDDPEYPLLQGMEDAKPGVDSQGKATLTVNKGDIFRKRLRTPREMPTSADNINDAMAISMGYQNGLDPDLIGKLMGITPDDAKKKILEVGRGFENPTTGMVETREKCLSSNVRKKLKDAMLAAKDDERYQANVNALEQVQPDWIPLSKMNYQLSGRWIPDDILTTFMNDALHYEGAATYVPAANTYLIGKASKASPEVQTTFGTDDLDAIDLMKHALDGTEPTVKRSSGSGKDKVTWVDPVATQAARDKMAELKREFVSWSKSSTTTVSHGGEKKAVGKALEDEFNAVNNAMVPPAYEGGHLEFPGLTGVTLRPHQAAAVARGLSEFQMVMAHGVGSGKTYTAIVYNRELRRLGLARKPMIVVQKATIGQFAASIRKAYPDAKVLVADEHSFTKNNRRKFMARAAMGDWDMIVVTQPAFERIPNDPRTVVSYYNQKLDELEEAIRSSDDDTTTKKLEAAKKQLEKKLAKAMDGLASRSDKTLFFEHMGVDALTIDEAHAYKRIPIVTRKAGVKGIPSDNSQKAVGTELKVMHVQSKNAGKGVVLATGTPITNTTAEAYVMLKLAAPNVLEQYHIKTFDDFANTFGETHSDMEYGWGGKWKQVTRFNRFTNQRALLNMIRSAFDVKMGNKELGLKVPRIIGGGPKVLIAPVNANVEKLNQWIMGIAERFEGLTGKERREYSWIPILTMQTGMAGALDPRLVDPSMPDSPDSKVNLAIKKIIGIYRDTTAATPTTVERGTQLVFADRFKPISTEKLEAFLGGKAGDIQQGGEEEGQLEADHEPKEGEEDAESEESKQETADYKSGGFNLYHDMRDKLIAAGIPKDQIAIIHDYNTDKQREKLFEQVNGGQIRVLIGSTEKMGVGVNVQKRLVGIHHMDPPRMMTPAMMEQRNGRIIRQGNENEEIHAINYGTEKSMDTGIYQMLENKGKAVVQLLQGRTSAEDFEDPFDEVTMSMAEMKGKLTGDDRAMRREELKGKIQTLDRQRAAFENEQASKVQKLDETRRRLSNYRDRWIPESIATNEQLQKSFGQGKDQAWEAKFREKTVTGRKELAEALDAVFEQMKNEIAKEKTKGQIAHEGAVINGVPVTFAVNSYNGSGGVPQITMYIRDKDGELIRSSEITTGTGSLASLQSTARNYPEYVERKKREANDAAAQIPALEKALGQTWDKGEELTKLQDEKRAVDASLLDDAPAAGAPSGIRFKNTRQGFIRLPEIQGIQDFGTHLVDDARRFSGKMFPTAQRLSPTVADRLAEYVASRIYAKEASPVVADWILTGDQPVEKAERDELDRLVGAVLTQDNLDSLRDKSDEPDEVHSLIGADNSPFHTEEEYEAAKRDPRVLSAIERYKEWFSGDPEANYRMSQGIDPEEELPPRGKEFKARVNLKAIDPDAEDADGKPIAPVIANKGNLRNPRKTPSPFARQASGKGEAYETSLEGLVTNTLTRGTEPANLARVYKAMTTNGLAVLGKGGLHPTLGDKATVAWDMKNRSIIIPGKKALLDEAGEELEPEKPTKAFGQNKVLYVRDDLIRELRRATNVDDPIHSQLVRGAASLANKAALASLSEAMYHLGNQVSALATTPGAGFVVPSMVKKAIGLLTNDPETRRQLVELAKIGGLREQGEPWNANPLKWVGKMIEVTDRLGRLVLDDAFKKLVKKKLIANTDANRRDLANKFGQYNKRAQHWMIWMARETGLGPFATAGTNFLTQGINTATLNPGVAGRNKAAALQLKGMMLMRYALALALVGLLNWLKWGRMDGSVKTPIGSIRVANDEQGNEKHFDLLDLIGLKRGLRSIGVLPAIEAKRKGATNAEAADAAVKEASSSFLRPFEGPLPRFGKIWKTGSDFEGHQVSHKAESGQSQSWEDTKAAIRSANPLVDLMTSDKTLSSQFGKFWLKSGGRDESAADVLARKLARDQAGEHPYTEPQLEKAQERREMVDALRKAGSNSEKDKIMEKAVKSGMTGAEAIRMRKASEKSDLENEVTRLTPDNLMRVWDAATSEEKDSLRQFAFSKIQASHLSHETKERLINRIIGPSTPSAK